MTITVYGKGGRTFRCLWMLGESELEYEHETVDWAQGESRTDAFLSINANGKVPVLRDDDLVLFESLAINYHLARVHAPHLWPDARESEATQWLAWGMGELEGPHDAANRTGSEVNLAQVEFALRALRKLLSKGEYMLSEQFSVVDLNTACLLLRPQFRSLAANDPEIGGWFHRCTSRSALARATA